MEKDLAIFFKNTKLALNRTKSETNSLKGNNL